MNHTVKAGEHIGIIAANYGFAGYEALWNNSQNDAIREKRKNPFQLIAGDIVAIPEKEPAVFEITTGLRIVLKQVASPLEVRIRNLDYNGDPVERECNAVFEDSSVVPAAQVDTIYTIPVTSATLSMDLTFPPSPPLDDHEKLPARIGWLEPIEMVDDAGKTVANPMGVQQRLNNLGYCAGYDDECDGTSMQYKWAVEEFQCDNKIPVDGKVGPTTRAKILEAHGC